MKLIIAKHIGFCTGVKRALFVAKQSLRDDPGPVQFLGEIVHNEKVIAEILEKGGKIISDPKSAKTGTLVIRAHGTPPLPRLKNIVIRDATCPLVRRAQVAAKELFGKKYKVIIIGEKKHPEIIGIQGNIKNSGIVIETETEAVLLKKFDKIGVIAQTTQNFENVKKILKILQRRAKELKWVNTLCPQVSLRQKELSDIAKRTEAVLVIGSKTSANTKQLAEIAASRGLVFRINSLKELKSEWLKNIHSLGVVSGTSAPDWEVEKIINFLNGYAKEKN